MAPTYSMIICGLLILHAAHLDEYHVIVSVTGPGSAIPQILYMRSACCHMTLSSASIFC